MACETCELSTVDHRGRITVPAEVRAQAGMKPGARLVWSVAEGDIVIVKLKTGTQTSRIPPKKR